MNNFEKYIYKQSRVKVKTKWAIVSIDTSKNTWYFLC